MKRVLWMIGTPLTRSSSTLSPRRGERAGVRGVFAMASLFLVAGCASKPPINPPTWTEVPAVVTDAMCGRLRGEAISGDATIAIVQTTQPLVSQRSLQSLGAMYNRAGNPSAIMQSMASLSQPLPVRITEQCHWKPITTINPDAHDEMVLQLSSPFVNPFAPQEAGVFARLSLAGRDAQWYWVPMAQRKGQGPWLIGMVLPMDLHES